MAKWKFSNAQIHLCQCCAGKCVTNSSLRGKKALMYIVFANFHDVNTTTVTNTKLPMV